MEILDKHFVAGQRLTAEEMNALVRKINEGVNGINSNKQSISNHDTRIMALERKIDESSATIVQASCDTDRYNANKQVSVDNFILDGGKPLDGCMLAITFANDNVVSGITLNVNYSTGGIRILYKGVQVEPGMIQAGSTVTVLYNRKDNFWNVLSGIDESLKWL